MNNEHIENGFIILARKLIGSEIWGKPSDYLKIWIYILMKVNHKEKYAFKRGENFFNWSDDIRDLKGVKRHTVDNCLRWLKSTEQITTQKTTRGMHLKVNNYEHYQDGKNYQLQDGLRNTLQSPTKQLQNTMDTINKNDNNERMIITNQPKDDFISMCVGGGYKGIYDGEQEKELSILYDNLKKTYPLLNLSEVALKFSLASKTSMINHNKYIGGICCRMVADKVEALKKVEEKEEQFPYEDYAR